MIQGAPSFFAPSSSFSPLWFPFLLCVLLSICHTFSLLSTFIYPLCLLIIVSYCRYSRMLMFLILVYEKKTCSLGCFFAWVIKIVWGCESSLVPGIKHFRHAVHAYIVMKEGVLYSPPYESPTTFCGEMQYPVVSPKKLYHLTLNELISNILCECQESAYGFPHLWNTFQKNFRSNQKLTLHPTLSFF